MSATSVRLRFTKHGKVRFTGHRDVARIWERAIRKAGVPIAYTQGFSPRPRMSFGLALPTGDESEGEYLDLLLDEPVEPGSLPERLSAALPEGFEVTGAIAIERSTPSLQESVTSCSWWFDVRELDEAGAAAFVDAVLGAEQIPHTRRRKGKEVDVDLRPAVASLAAVGASQRGQAFEAELAAKPFSVRPAELIAAIDSSLELGLARRTQQWIDGDGDRREPLPVAAPAAALAGART
ncbi:MAG: TIGR03936 family radical SAM-associated protein [Actinomycetota bacterium]